MAIGGVSNGSGYTIGGKSVGAKATDLFGDNSARASNIFFANAAAASGGASFDNTQLIVKGLQDQIDRLQGFRTNLTPAEKEQLTKYQQTISDINQLGQARALTKGEISDRAEAYVESYKILGKEYQDFSNDNFIQKKSKELTDLLASKPVGAEAKRLKVLQTMYDKLVDSAMDRDTEPPGSLMAQISNVGKLINKLTAPRSIASLTPEELRHHDDLVEEINDHAGFDVELTSTKKLQIERLQKTMETIQQGVYA